MLNFKNFVPLRNVNLEKTVIDGTLFTGGHFIILNNKVGQMNDGTIASFAYAVSLYSQGKKKGKHVGLGILINDIGQTCSQSVCTINAPFSKTTFVLPEEYTKVLAEFGVDHNEVLVFWEKHIRNRGKKELMKVVGKRHDIEKIENDYWLNDRGGFGKVILSRGNANDKYGTPGCPLIMGALALEQEKSGFSRSVNFYYIGNDNQTNIPNHFVIEKGSVVARKFGATIEVNNVFLMRQRI